MSLNLQQVAEDVRGLARTFRSVQSLAEFVDNIGALEQHQRDLERLNAEAAAELERANSAAAKARSDAAHIAVVAEAKAAEVIDAAKNAAAFEVAQANSKAESIVAEAQAKVAEAEESARKQSGYALEAQQMADQARAELADLEKRIEAAKNTIKNMLGAN